MWLDGRDLIVLDTETTGLSPTRDRVVQLGLAHFRDGVLLGKSSAMVNPRVPIPEATTAIHGFGDADVAQADCFGDAFSGLCAGFPMETAILCAYNAEFDQPFIMAEMVRNGVVGSHIAGDWLCSLALAKAIRGVGKYERGYRLTDLCEKLGIEFDGAAHDAANDAEASGRLLYALTKWLPDSEAEVRAKQLAWQRANSR